MFSIKSRLTRLAEENGIRVSHGYRKALRDGWEKLRGEGVGSVLLRGSAGNFIVKIAGAALGFGAHVILGRTLGVDQYGIFVYVYSWVRILAMVSRLGFQTSLVRFVAQYRGKEAWALLRGVCRSSFRLVAAVSAVLALGLEVCVLFFPDFFGEARIPAFLIGALGLPFLGLLSVEKAALRGLKRVIFADLPEKIFRQGGLLLSVAVCGLFLVEGEMSASFATALHGGAMAGAFAGGLITLRWALPSDVRSCGEDEFRRRKWLITTMPLLFTSSMFLVSRQSSMILVGWLGSDNAAGLFGAGLRITSLVTFGLGATNMIVAPMISELYHQGKDKELQRMLSIAAYGIFGWTVIASAVLILGGPWLLAAFGSGFGAGYIPLVILLVGQVVNSLCGAVGYLMAMTGHQNEAALIVTGSVVVNVLAGIAFIPPLGAAGGAIAMTAGKLFWNFLMLGYVLIRLELNPSVLPTRWLPLKLTLKNQ